MKNISSILWGIAFIAIGTIVGLNMFGLTNINIFFDGWWTLFIIIPCFIHLFSEEKKTGNIIGLIIGILFLLSSQEILDFAIVWKLLFPIILIIIGLSFIFKNFIGNKVNQRIKEIKGNSTKQKEYIATFSGQKIDFSNEDFTGCKLSAIFGGIELDLEDANIKEDVVIDITSIFGGVDIRVPKGVNIKENSTSILGGIDNKAKNKKDNKITIYINSVCVFGGVEIK